MAKLREVETALLFAGVLYSDEERYREAYAALKEVYGDIAMETPPVAWDFSGYYQDEMGSPIQRRFLFFRNMIMPDKLAAMKHLSIDIETRMSVGSRRQINIDPGYLNAAKLVLASTKDYSHRIYIGESIYAEATLIFKEKNFIPHIHTYNDYKDERYQRYFLLGRELFFLLKRNN